MTYDNIKLITYLHVTNTGDFNCLCLSNNASQEECFIAWENIIRRNGEVNGDMSYSQFFNKTASYAKLLDDYQLIKAILIRLHFVIDDGYIAFLRNKGYKINLTSGTEYRNSLMSSMRRCENILTKLAMRTNELVAIEKEAEKKSVSIEQILASISAGLGFEVKDDLTLARYNEYKKIIVAKNKQHGRNNKARYNNR